GQVKLGVQVQVGRREHPAQPADLGEERLLRRGLVVGHRPCLDYRERQLASWPVLSVAAQVGHHSPILVRRLGSSQSRRPSPSRLKPNTVIASATPRNVGYHHDSWMYEMASAAIEPHSACGGRTPRPRKLSDEVSRMA